MTERTIVHITNIHNPRPILFSGPMVRAILEGRKTQTRRPVKFKSWPDLPVVEITDHGAFADEPAATQRWSADHKYDGGILVEQEIRCPYGLVGERLFVRETLKRRGEKPYFGATYAADKKDVILVSKGGHMQTEAGWPWKKSCVPSIHMPRWASRITLEITKVRVERLREISLADVNAEGGSSTVHIDEVNARSHFAERWNAIYAARGFGWDKNPWVWVVEFKRV